jgi:GAF domain-containing protein
MGAPAQIDHGGNFADILAICQRINSERDLGALLDLIAREAIKLLDCDRASIFLLDRDRNELWSKVALGSDEILRFDAANGIAGAAVTGGGIINVLDAYSDPRFFTGIDLQTGPSWPSLCAIRADRSLARSRSSTRIRAYSIAAMRTPYAPSPPMPPSPLRRPN